MLRLGLPESVLLAADCLELTVVEASLYFYALSLETELGLSIILCDRENSFFVFDPEIMVSEFCYQCLQVSAFSSELSNSFSWDIVLKDLRNLEGGFYWDRHLC